MFENKNSSDFPLNQVLKVLNFMFSTFWFPDIKNNNNDNK